MMQPVTKTSAPRMLHLLSFLLASVIDQGSSSLVCLFNSVEDLTCNWIPLKNVTNAPCNITAFVDYGDSNKSKTFQLHGAGTKSYRLILKDYNLIPGDDIVLDVFCHNGKKWENVDHLTMKPFVNIQLDPPLNVQMENISKHSCILTWELNVLSHYLTDKLEYEVKYKVYNSGEDDRILPILQDQKWVKIENLSPDTLYEAAIRAKIQKSRNYNSTWSHWSISTTWKTKPTEPPNILLPVLLVGSLVIVCISITVLGKSTLLKCLKKTVKIQLPNPDEFFPSLNAVHGGDIQKWLSPVTSIDAFHIATAHPEVSVLEIMQKESQESSPLTRKEYSTNVNTPETSGYSSSSCFSNGGYFFFQHDGNSFGIQPCKVYFTYDPLAQEGSGSEDADSCSYKVLHETVDNSQLSPTYNIMAAQENSSFLQEAKSPTQTSEGGSGDFSSLETISTKSSVEEDSNQNAIVLSRSLGQFSMVYSSLPEKIDTGNNGTEVVQNVDLPISSIEDDSSAFLQSIMQNQSQVNVPCRAASHRQFSTSSDGYLSLRDLQSHYSHHSV
ncbi:interleukin-2 receptor subunit beta [Anolis carolinensis]|uniref:interleukin-2 receptor subunit beta n=1 Tax=Anolis carolinensis TaxID=28377 RepID=UPI002F2B753A